MIQQSMRAITVMQLYRGMVNHGFSSSAFHAWQLCLIVARLAETALWVRCFAACANIYDLAKSIENGPKSRQSLMSGDLTCEKCRSTLDFDKFERRGKPPAELSRHFRKRTTVWLDGLMEDNRWRPSR
jgi:hypothetical protein